MARSDDISAWYPAGTWAIVMRGEPPDRVMACAMDTEHVLSTIRSLEDRRTITAAGLAHELGVDPVMVQAMLDELVLNGELCRSELRTRPNEGYDFKLRSIWYHTPEREVTARFGAILSTDGTRTRPSSPTPRPDAKAPASLAS
jgi:hypothetical protein